MTKLWAEEFFEQEDAGREQLQAYCSIRGRQADICRKSGLDKAELSRMLTGDRAIGLEAALRIEVATKGKFTVEILCPSKAYLLRAALLMRYG